MSQTNMIDEEIYFVICVDKTDSSYEYNTARNEELEGVLFRCGLSRHAILVNDKTRVCQSYRKFALGNRNGSLAYNTLFGQSLAKAFGTKVWLHHDGDGEFLLTSDNVEKVSGNLDTAIETLLGEKTSTKTDICNYPATNGSLAEHGRASMAISLEEYGIDGVAKEVEGTLPEYDDDISPNRLIVKREIIATAE